MDLKNIGFLFLLAGISSILIYFLLELYSMAKIKRWLKKNKEALLLDEYIKNKYLNEVIGSQEYYELKEIYDNAPFLFKKVSLVGLNYLDFYFFQNLMGYYYNKEIDSLVEVDIFNRLRKVLWIVLSFRTSLLFRRFGLFCIKFTMVYFVVLFCYDKLF